MVSNTRVLLVAVLTALFVSSTIYNMTFTFTKSLVRQILLEEQRQLGVDNTSLRAQQDQPKQRNAASTLTPCQEESSSALKSKDEPESWNEIEQVLKHKDNQSKADGKQQMPDTTIIVTTNWMPGLPSTKMIDGVINSLHFLDGLPSDTPLIIAADGPYMGERPDSVRSVDMRAYLRALECKYNNSHTTIISSSKKIMLVGNMKRALRLVETEFILVLQHDLPFINEVNHTALVEIMHTHPEVRLVRFPTAIVLSRKRDTGVCNEDEIEFHANGVGLTKTHTWSDRYVFFCFTRSSIGLRLVAHTPDFFSVVFSSNHLTRKSYYEEMFKLPGWEGIRAMEFHMSKFAKENCSYWGTHMYGHKGENPTIFHLDGRRDGEYRTQKIYGNLTGLL
eukprot:scaffold5532_cov195-Cylindrotheca_fusiformis.AAC.4